MAAEVGLEFLEDDDDEEEEEEEDSKKEGREANGDRTRQKTGVKHE